MRVFTDLSQWREFQPPELGFVPTMGALHAGHLALVERSRRENQATLVSIFINPTQFDNPQDLAAYPHDLAADALLLEQAGVDYLLAPNAEQMYPMGYRHRILESTDSLLLCGAHRPGHFDGMLTVVMKLLQLARARRAYFGEKDFQQLLLVRQMVSDFFLPVEIVACPIIRESDGLAMSSRNRRLDDKDRHLAARLFEILQSPQTLTQIETDLKQAGFEVDYVEHWKGRRLAAVRLGGVRLIDNIPWEEA
jgi:pantoate--beta-alanine ligase